MAAALASAHPMTGLQESLFILSSEQTSSESFPPYVEQFSCCIVGCRDIAEFQQAWCDLTDRHAALRTLFTKTKDGKLVQAVLTQRHPFVEIRVGAVRADVAKLERQTAFDLKTDPLLRIILIPGQNDRIEMIVTFHHIIMDAFSAPVMMDDLMSLYADRITGQCNTPPPSAASPGHLADLQAARRGAAGQAYWRNVLRGAQVPALPIINSGRPSGALGRHVKPITAETAQALDNAAPKLGVSPSTVLHAVWGVVLSRLTESNKVVFASVMANRGHDLLGIEDAIGLFAATLPVAIDIRGDKTFADLCQDTQRQLQDAALWSAMSLSEITAAAGLTNTSIDHTMIGRPKTLAWGDEETLHFERAGITMNDYTAHSWDHYDFQMGFTLGAAPYLEARHDPTRCPQSGVEMILELTHDLLGRLLAAPDVPIVSLPMCSGDLPQGRLATPATTDVARCGTAILAGPPDQEILCDSDGSLSRHALENAVCERANALAINGVTTGDRVAISAAQDRSFTLNALACWRIGAAFVPVDPRWPFVRQQAVIAAAEPKHLIDLPAHSPANKPKQDDGSLAYIIFTSGSTGTPKGVAVPHAALDAYCECATQRLGFLPTDRALQVSSPAFDLGYTTAFALMAAGGACHWIGAENAVDPDRILREMAARKITVLKATPSFLRLLLSAPEPRLFKELGAWRLLILGGESPDEDVLEQLVSHCPQLKIAMHYGPAETTIGCTIGVPALLSDHHLNRIGTPIAGSEIRIIDRFGMTRPRGISGEIAIGGISVAAGYLVPTPDDGFIEIDKAPFYRSGDVGRVLADGSLCFEGRRNGDFKIRGQRVDPQETRTALLELTDIADAAVGLRAGADGPELVAFIVSINGEKSVSTLRRTLAQSLPNAQIPQRFVFLSRILLTGSGKVDMQAMLASLKDAPATPHKPRHATTATERTLVVLWQDILGVDVAHANDDFYALGGHSLRALEIAARFKKQHGKNLPLRWFNDFPELSEFAAQIDNVDTSKNTQDETMLRLWDKPGDARMLCLPGPMGNSSIHREWLAQLSVDFAVDGIDQMPDVDTHGDMGSIARLIVQKISENGYNYSVITGWSFGADLAVAIAGELNVMGQFPRVILLDRVPGQPRHDIAEKTPLCARRYWANVMNTLSETSTEEDVLQKEEQFHARQALQDRYQPSGPIQSDILAVLTAAGGTSAALARLTTGASQVISCGGDHYSLFHPPHVADWTAQLRSVLHSALSAPTTTDC